MSGKSVDFKKYLSIETLGGASWHPNKNQLVYVSNSSGSFQIYTGVVGEDSGREFQKLTDEPDRCTNPKFLSDGTILFTRDRGGDENFQFGLLREGELHWVTTTLDAKYRLNKVTDNYIYYISNELDRSRLDLYRRRIPLLENKPELLYKPVNGIVHVDVVSDHENQIVITRRLGNVEHEIFILSLPDGKIKEITQLLPESSKTRWITVRYIDENHILVVTDYKSDIKRFGVLSTEGKFVSFDDLANKLNSSIEYTTWGKHAQYTYFTTNDEGYSSLFRCVFTPLGYTDYKKIEMEFKGTLSSGDARSFSDALQISPDGMKLALTFSSPTYPISSWIIETESGRMWQPVQTDYTDLNRDAFIDCTLQRISSFDELSIPYYRYIPQGIKPETGWPTIIVIHGGPESQIRPAFNPVIQAFLALGFAVIAPNIRGSTGYGKEYLALDDVEKRLDSIKDIKVIANILDENDQDVDGQRLVIFGGSYGGFAVLSAITEYPEIWKAAVEIVGISNFVTFLQNTADWRRPIREAEYGSLEHDMDLLVSISPIHKVDKIQCPLFIIQGDNDERVPLSESIQMYEKVKEKGVPVRLLRFADEGHGLAKLKNKIEAYTEIFEWLIEIV